MKIPGTPRRMDNEFVGALENFTHSMEEFGVMTEQFNASLFREASSYRLKPKPEEITTLDNHMRTVIGLNTNYSIKVKSEPRAQLTPAICSCCGGRIGKDNYCEFCGTRYW